MSDTTVLLRYEAVWCELGRRSEKWMAYQADKIARALRAFDAAPPEEISDVGTIALASALGYLDLRFEGACRTEHPRLVAWLDVFSDATSSFEATRVRGDGASLPRPARGEKGPPAAKKLGVQAGAQHDDVHARAARKPSS